MYGQSLFGLPSLYLLNKDGKNINLNVLSDKKAPIIDMCFLDSLLFLMMPKKIFKIDLKTIKILNELDISKDKTKLEFTEFLNSKKYKKVNDSSSYYEPVVNNNLIIKTKSGDTLYKDLNLNPILDFKPIIRYSILKRTNGSNLLYNKNEILFADKNNKIISITNKFENIIFRNNQLYGLQANNLYQIDLSQFKQ